MMTINLIIMISMMTQQTNTRSMDRRPLISPVPGKRRARRREGERGGAHVPPSLSSHDRSSLFLSRSFTQSTGRSAANPHPGTRKISFLSRASSSSSSSLFLTLTITALFPKSWAGKRDRASRLHSRSANRHHLVGEHTQRDRQTPGGDGGGTGRATHTQCRSARVRGSGCGCR